MDANSNIKINLTECKKYRNFKANLFECLQYENHLTSEYLLKQSIFYKESLSENESKQIFINKYIEKIVK